MRVEITNKQIRRAWLSRPSDLSNGSYRRQNFWRQFILTKLRHGIPKTFDFLLSLVRPIYRNARLNSSRIFSNPSGLNHQIERLGNVFLGCFRFVHHSVSLAGRFYRTISTGSGLGSTSTVNSTRRAREQTAMKIPNNKSVLITCRTFMVRLWSGFTVKTILKRQQHRIIGYEPQPLYV